MRTNSIHKNAYRAQYISKSDIQVDESQERPIHGIWIHATSVKSLIIEEGWKPHLNTNSIYGTAIYLAKIKWDLEENLLASVLRSMSCELPDPFEYFGQPDTMLCQLVLNNDEIMCEFSSSEFGDGNTETQLLGYLRSQGVKHNGRTPSPGNSRSNLAIASHFSEKSIKAIHFKEEDIEVVAVYDPSCIRIIRDKHVC